eukprot:jgi/Mesen1/7544/ME000392S06813
MVIDSASGYKQIRDYLKDIAPELVGRLELHRGREPLFDRFRLESAMRQYYSRRVKMSNGGSIVLEETEALVTIDVNGGSGMMGQQANREAILEINLAAARQIAIEMRRRDIGGIIVVDFIDQDDAEGKALVYAEMQRAVERDRSKVAISRISEYGLMEIIRQRVRASIMHTISDSCPMCMGAGRFEEERWHARQEDGGRKDAAGDAPVSVSGEKFEEGGPRKWRHGADIRKPLGEGGRRRSEEEEEGEEEEEEEEQEGDASAEEDAEGTQEEVEGVGRAKIDRWQHVDLKVDKSMFAYLRTGFKGSRLSQMSRDIGVHITPRVYPELTRGQFEVDLHRNPAESAVLPDRTRGAMRSRLSFIKRPQKLFQRSTRTPHLRPLKLMPTAAGGGLVPLAEDPMVRRGAGEKTPREAAAAAAAAAAGRAA